MIAIIDYDAGNIKSVEKAIQFLEEEAVITRDPEKILSAEGVILPGVGSFGDAMARIRSYELEAVIHEVVERKIQLMFEKSDETPGVQGLALLPGEIVRIPDDGKLKVPHIGWNSLHFPKENRLFQGIEEDSYVYFVHSYYLKAGNIDDVAATTEYGTLIHAAVEHGNIFACQFHPEKSSEVGLHILKNFITICREEK